MSLSGVFVPVAVGSIMTIPEILKSLGEEAISFSLSGVLVATEFKFSVYDGILDILSFTSEIIP